MWRSQPLYERIHNLDQRLTQGPQQLCNRRRPGPHSTRLPTSRVPQEFIDSLHKEQFKRTITFIFCVYIIIYALSFINLGEGPNYSSNSEDCLLIIKFGRSRQNLLKSHSNFLFLLIILRSIWPNYPSLSLQVIDFKSWHNDP